MKTEYLQEKGMKEAREKTKRVLTSRYIEELELRRETDKATVIIKSLYEQDPNDPVIQYHYGKILRRSNLYNEALEIFRTLDDKLIMSKIEQIRCLIELESWYQVIELCKKCKKEMNEGQETLIKFLDRAWVYAHKKIGKLPKMDREFSYVEKQIYAYSRENAKEYIKENYQFEEKERLEELFDNAESVLPKGKFIPNVTTLTDTYLYSYITQQNTVDTLKAIAVHNTNDLIFLYPAKELKRNWAKMVQDDLLLLDSEKAEKRPTQVEKFKQKYKKFL